MIDGADAFFGCLPEYLRIDGGIKNFCGKEG